MKQAFLIFTCLLISSHCIVGQSMKTQEWLKSIEGTYSIDENNTITYVKVIELDSLSKDEIYKQAKSYFIYNYHDAKSVLQEDNSEDGRLIGKGIFSSVYNGTVFLVSVSFDVSHILRIDIKENKARLVLTLLMYNTTWSSTDGTDYNDYNITETYPFNEKAMFKTLFGKAFYATHNYAQAKLIEVEKALRYGNTSQSIEKDNW
jgi:hypothetical protein